MKINALNNTLSPLLSSAILVLLLDLITSSNAFSRSTLPSQHSLTASSLESREIANTNIQTKDFDSTQTNYELFLRFSPLIGGPPFLPLHVEVILVPEINIEEDKLEAMLKSAPNEYVEIHRFDFLPENPTEPATIARLMQLQGVPGRVRYRCCPSQNGGDLQGVGDAAFNNLMELQTANNNQSQDRGVTIIFRFGSSSSKKSTTTVLSTAVDYANLYRITDGRELRILGGKNCLSFALDMISHLDDAHGIDAKLSLPKIF